MCHELQYRWKSQQVEHLQGAAQPKFSTNNEKERNFKLYITNRSLMLTYAIIKDWGMETSTKALSGKHRTIGIFVCWSDSGFGNLSN